VRAVSIIDCTAFDQYNKRDQYTHECLIDDRPILAAERFAVSGPSDGAGARGRIADPYVHQLLEVVELLKGTADGWIRLSFYHRCCTTANVKREQLAGASMTSLSERLLTVRLNPQLSM
jgi:hypothetical protein